MLLPLLRGGWEGSKCMPDITTQLKTLFGDRLKENEPMSKHVNFRIGGPARWFAEVKSVEELEKAIALCRESGVEWFVMGGGSNTLVADEGFDGVVLKMAMREFVIEGTTVTAESGVLSVALARATADAGLKGFTWAIGLPGTIGGAVRGNAGCFGGETKERLISAKVLRDGKVIELSKVDLDFGYRESAIKHSNDTVLSATFELEPGDSEALKKQLDETLAKRKASQPLHAGSAGCIFKNYEISDDEELQRLKRDADIPTEMQKSRRISAGWLVDQLDLKGSKIGGAQISEEHGNFIVNLGDATASDVVQLIAMAKMKARNTYGIQLQEEVQYLGF